MLAKINKVLYFVQVYQLSAQAIDAKLFTIDMRTEAGAYIKELVHGDFGRTVPSITSILGLDTDILALDVTVSVLKHFVIAATRLANNGG